MKQTIATTSFDFFITPTTVEPGERLVTVVLKNLEKFELSALAVSLNSRDTYGIFPEKTQYLANLFVGEEARFNFRIQARTSSEVYVSVHGFKDDREFYWESRSIKIVVGSPSAQITGVRATVSGAVECDAALVAFRDTDPLLLEMYSEDPSGAIDSLEIIQVPALKKGETRVYHATLLPERVGTYTIHTYLFDGLNRIDYGRQMVSVEE